LANTKKYVNFTKKYILWAEKGHNL